MPKDTFLNLAKEKQDRVINAIVKEFAERGYQGASVSNIAEQAGVAKGSIYQYFESKKELFFYILDVASKIKIDFLAEYIYENPNLPFFHLIEKMFEVGIRFSQKHPEFYRIYQDIQHGAPKEIRKEFYEKVNTLGQQHYQGFIKQAISKGEIRKDIAEDLACFVVYILLKNFGDFLVNQQIIFCEEKSKEYVRQCIEMLKNGIKA